jgi:hypothetical protein
MTPPPRFDTLGRRISRRKDASPLPRGLRACAWCGTVKMFRSGRRYCGYVCAAHGRTMAIGDVEMVARATRASHASAAKRAQAVIARLAGMTPLEAYRLGRKLGYTDGYQSGAYKARRRVAA